jgi:hypothetical protein
VLPAEVCRGLGLGGLLDRLPRGLEERIGEVGWLLSDGEASRLCLARAVLQAPDVLIVDPGGAAGGAGGVGAAKACPDRDRPRWAASSHARHAWCGGAAVSLESPRSLSRRTATPRGGGVDLLYRDNGCALGAAFVGA